MSRRTRRREIIVLRAGLHIEFFRPQVVCASVCLRSITFVSHPHSAALHSQIPAPVKMVQVLGALLSAEAESAGGGAGGGMGGGLWGTEDSDDDDYSDDDSNGAGGGAEGAAVEHAEHAAVLKAAG